MRILHTADWHLGDRLGRIDRTEDLRRAVERVAHYCRTEKVDVLLVAGDLFSEVARPDGLRDAIRHLQELFEGFLRDGGTILTLTGNHDNENFCQTLRHAMDLAAPLSGQPGEVAQSGRLYLAAEPTLLHLADRSGGYRVQFILMPYPTPARYLDGEAAQRYQNHEEKNRLLQTAYTRKLQQIQSDARFDPKLPTVLSAHIHVHGSTLPTLFRLTEQEDIVFAESDLPTSFAYIALGHIHKPQFLGGLSHVRYSGSIERMDLGERDDQKGVVRVDIDADGRRGEPVCLPLEATPVYAIQVRDPRAELPMLRQQYPDAANDLVNIEFTYTAGVDSLEEILRELEAIFPRWYHRDWTEAGALGQTLTVGEHVKAKSFEDTVRDYLRQELMNEPDAMREAILTRAEHLMREVEP
jgi:exonuclease SbcD